MTNVECSEQPFTLAPVWDKIDSCFSRDSVEDVLAALERDGSEWAQKTLKTLQRVSPTALKVCANILLVCSLYSYCVWREGHVPPDTARGNPVNRRVPSDGISDLPALYGIFCTVNVLPVDSSPHLCSSTCNRMDQAQISTRGCEHCLWTATKSRSGHTHWLKLPTKWSLSISSPFQTTWYWVT